MVRTRCTPTQGPSDTYHHLATHAPTRVGPPPTNQIARVIDTFSEGFANGEPSSTQEQYSYTVMSIDDTKKKPRRMARHPAIYFKNKDFVGVDPNLDDTVVVSVVVLSFLIKKVLVDQGSSIDLLYLPTLRRMGIPERELRPFHRNLIGFSGRQVGIRGYIDLLTSFGTAPLVKTVATWYLVVDCQTPYNALLG